MILANWEHYTFFFWGEKQKVYMCVCVYAYILIFSCKMSQSWLQAVVATAVEIPHCNHNHCSTGSRWMHLQFLLDYQTFSSLLPFLENTEMHNPNIIILRWTGKLIMQSMNVLNMIFAAAQQTSCRAIRLDIRENVKSALRKQTEEYLQIWEVRFSKYLTPANNKNAMMTIRKLPIALGQYLCCTQIPNFNIILSATCHKGSGFFLMFIHIEMEDSCNSLPPYTQNC